jgi:hypothetical protein
MAICALAQKDEHRETLGNLNACETILAGFNAHVNNEFVVKECALAMDALCRDNDLNKSKVLSWYCHGTVMVLS